MRIFVVLLSIGMTVLLLGCVLLNGGTGILEGRGLDARDHAGERRTAVGGVGGPVTHGHAGERRTGAANGFGSLASGDGHRLATSGPTSLEERIVASPVIARVRLDSVTSTAESGPTFPWDEVLRAH